MEIELIVILTITVSVPLGQTKTRWSSSWLSSKMKSSDSTCTSLHWSSMSCGISKEALMCVLEVVDLMNLMSEPSGCDSEKRHVQVFLPSPGKSSCLSYFWWNLMVINYGVALENRMMALANILNLYDILNFKEKKAQMVRTDSLCTTRAISASTQIQTMTRPMPLFEI